MSNTAGGAKLSGDRPSAVPLEFQLLSLLERRLDAFAQRADLRSEVGVYYGTIAAEPDQLIGKVQRRDDGDAVETDNLARVADLAHPGVEEFGGVEQVRALGEMFA